MILCAFLIYLTEIVLNAIVEQKQTLPDGIGVIVIVPRPVTDSLRLGFALEWVREPVSRPPMLRVESMDP